jgi:outer membrane usher protein
MPAYSPAAEMVIMKVFLNTEDKGEHFLVMTPEGDVLFPALELKDMGIKEIPEGVEVEVEGEEYIPLDSLSPGVCFEIDEKESALRITAEPKLLERHVVDLSYRRPLKVTRTEGNSAFLNYSLSYNLGDDLDFTSLSIPWEVGISVRGLLGFSSFAYTKSDTEEKFVRLITNITRDDTVKLRRFVLGDFPAFSGRLGGGGTLGGLSVLKNFSITPFFIRSPGLDLSGTLETPSDVEVYVNDIMVKSEHLPPGEFEFLNLPGATGYGDTTLVIKDAFGRERRITTPFYRSTVLLKPGLHDYSYNIGFKREDIGQDSFEYSDPAFVGFHRVGLTRALTAGLRAEADEDVVNIGPEAKLLLWRFGEIDTSLAVSIEDGQFGYGGFLSYLYAGRGFSSRFSLRGFTREYANLNLSSSQDKPRFEGIVGLGFNQELFGSISATYSITDLYTGTDTKRISLFYSRRLLRNFSIHVTASRTKTNEVIEEVFVGLNYFIGSGKTGSLGYRVQDGMDTETLSFLKNPPRGRGSGYRFLVERREDNEGEREVGGNASAQYRGHYGIYRADYRRSAEQNNYSLNVSGGLAFINRSLFLTRPIIDSFALVKVGDIEDVRVKYNNQEVGVTNRRGEVLVPGLISYYDNNLSIDDKDIPVNYEIAEIKKFVSTPLRGAGVVKFDVTKLQAFVGIFYIVEKGDKKPAEYWGLEIRIDDRLIEVIVGKGGEFYLENLPASRFPARLFLKDKECDFDIIIPESDDIMVDMEEVTCEMD